MAQVPVLVLGVVGLAADFSGMMGLGVVDLLIAALDVPTRATG